METEDTELDVEGVDDDGPSSLGLDMDPNELPSASSHLSPELSQHPWLTFDEQFNSHIPTVILHDDMDESSRATIHQMIKEENSYLQTKKIMRCKNKGLKTLFIPKKPKKLSSFNTRWTEEEKDLFKEGIDEHGHRWKKIADVIKTRNHVQVKNYARNYLQNQTASKDGQDFSNKCSVKVLESQTSQRLEADGEGPMDGNEEHGGDSKEDQHLLVLDDEEEEDVDIDVEETSDIEQKGPGLQSTLLFGDILRHSVPIDNTDLDSQQDKTSDFAGNTEQGNENLDQKQRATINQKTITKLKDSKSPSPEMQTDIGADDVDVNIAVNVAAIMNDNGLLNIKTENQSSEEDAELTICLSGQTTNPRKDRRLKKNRRGWKGSRKRMKESSEEECSEDECEALVVVPVIDSVTTTQESSLPGNMRPGRGLKTRKKEGMKQNKRKARRKQILVKEEMEFEVKSEEHDYYSEGYMEIESEMEKGGCDRKEHEITSGIKTVFVRNKDYTQLCKSSLDEKSVIARIVQSEPDATSSADTQHSSSEGSGQQNTSGCSSMGQIVKEFEEKRTLELSHQQVSRDPPSFEALQTPTTEDSEASNERNVGPECSKEHQDKDDDRDKTGSGDGEDEGSNNAGQTTGGEESDDEDEGSNNAGQTTGGEESNDDTNSFEQIKDQSCEESDEEIIEPPKEEVTLDPSHVTEGEKEAHPNFFDFSSSAKTPERYLAIRNHIIKFWLKIKPTYLNKTAARNGLKSGGDVNLIGLIHEYLESIGAINFGAYNPNQQKVKKRRSTVERWANMYDPEAKTSRLESMRPRRKIFSKFPGDIDDKTSSVIEKQKKPKSKPPKPPAYDPFKLIDCHKFSSTLPAPFSVKVKGDAMVTMDVHSHLSTTEVIGLLGGDFDPVRAILEVRIARPCRSLSTGMQCEMDPVSQTEACEDIQSAGCRVVGWYHSHPTFSPNPSIRDIETQGHFQDWFSQDTKTPFIGVIVSPYHSRQLVTSKINCLTVSQQWSPDHQCWRPYKFDFSVYQDKDVVASHQQLLSIASHLIAEFAQYKYRVEMLWVCPGQSGITYLEKMLESISTSLCGCEETKAETVSKLKYMVYAHFDNPTIIKDSTLDVTLSFDSSP
ncbi:histone H2A deubiquitinase MYSM1 isoform X2 [Strongylocentrotus purpuratus]|uniref:Myb-like, SWIRM and MPN domain-containing protein 1 n=1 Tax=Strongylocentrotus purpuratus TaxID=7668 RepID=A0A7M7PMD7_STRPU|nr:histone H2A deubiquitinase MYSM1 isoform X2 [Strongylocentrotus purpuratus]